MNPTLYQFLQLLRYRPCQHTQMSKLQDGSFFMKISRFFATKTVNRVEQLITTTTIRCFVVENDKICEYTV